MIVNYQFEPNVYVATTWYLKLVGIYFLSFIISSINVTKTSLRRFEKIEIAFSIFT